MHFAKLQLRYLGRPAPLPRRLVLVAFLCLAASGCEAPRPAYVLWRSYLPTRYPDGTPVPATEMAACVEQVVQEFGGCTTTPGAVGYWLNPQTRQVEVDAHLTLDVACPRAMLTAAQRRVVAIGQRLRQVAMYFEVRDPADIRILPVPVSVPASTPHVPTAPPARPAMIPQSRGG